MGPLWGWLLLWAVSSFGVVRWLQGVVPPEIDEPPTVKGPAKTQPLDLDTGSLAGPAGEGYAVGTGPLERGTGPLPEGADPDPEGPVVGTGPLDAADLLAHQAENPEPDVLAELAERLLPPDDLEREAREDDLFDRLAARQLTEADAQLEEGTDPSPVALDPDLHLEPETDQLAPGGLEPELASGPLGSVEELGDVDETPIAQADPREDPVVAEVPLSEEGPSPTEDLRPVEEPVASEAQTDPVVLEEDAPTPAPIDAVDRAETVAVDEPPPSSGPMSQAAIDALFASMAAPASVEAETLPDEVPVDEGAVSELPDAVAPEELDSAHGESPAASGPLSQAEIDALFANMAAPVVEGGGTSELDEATLEDEPPAAEVPRPSNGPMSQADIDALFANMAASAPEPEEPVASEEVVADLVAPSPSGPMSQAEIDALFASVPTPASEDERSAPASEEPQPSTGPMSQADIDALFSNMAATETPKKVSKKAPKTEPTEASEDEPKKTPKRAPAKRSKKRDDEARPALRTFDLQGIRLGMGSAEVLSEFGLPDQRLPRKGGGEQWRYGYASREGGALRQGDLVLDLLDDRVVGKGLEPFETNGSFEDA